METIVHPKLVKANKDHRCMFCLDKIDKGAKYYKSTHTYDGDIYNWKTHQKCADIANELKMYDNCEEGVTSDDFIEDVKSEYSKIMHETQSELYKSKDFVIPKFLEQLKFVLTHHGILTN